MSDVSGAAINAGLAQRHNRRPIVSTPPAAAFGLRLCIGPFHDRILHIGNTARAREIHDAYDDQGSAVVAVNVACDGAHVLQEAGLQVRFAAHFGVAEPPLQRAIHCGNR